MRADRAAAADNGLQLFDAGDVDDEPDELDADEPVEEALTAFRPSAAKLAGCNGF